MQDIPISQAMLLWNAGFNGGEPAFAVRPLGHDDYDRFDYQVGACFAKWQKSDDSGRKFQLMIDIWHIAAFYWVPIHLMRDQLLRIPEYRDMLADDCLPREHRR